MYFVLHMFLKKRLFNINYNVNNSTPDLLIRLTYKAFLLGKSRSMMASILLVLQFLSSQMWHSAKLNAARPTPLFPSRITAQTYSHNQIPTLLFRSPE